MIKRKFCLNEVFWPIIPGIIVGISVSLITIEIQSCKTKNYKEAEERKNSILMLQTIKDELNYNKGLLYDWESTLNWYSKIKNDSIFATCGTTADRAWEAATATGLISTIKDPEVVFLLSKVYSKIDFIIKDVEYVKQLELNTNSKVNAKDLKVWSSQISNNIGRTIMFCDSAGIYLIDSYIDWQNGVININEYKEKIQHIYQSFSETVFYRK